MARTASLLVLGSLALAGCTGSTLAYRPRIGEGRPDPAFRAGEDERVALTNAVPVEIDRTEAYFAQGAREQQRIKGETPRNPWDEYEYDVVRVFKKEHEADARRVLGGRLPRPRGGAPAAAPGEGGEAEGGDDE